MPVRAIIISFLSLENATMHMVHCTKMLFDSIQLSFFLGKDKVLCDCIDGWKSIFVGCFLQKEI
jgi:hypothetical protein